jgi:hypothetical protein
LIITITGNIQIVITTAEKIYFYTLEAKTDEPLLENIIFNFMKCTNVVMGTRAKFFFSYTQLKQGFDIIKRKYFHHYEAPLTSDNFENCKGIEITAAKVLVLSNGTKL